MYHARSLCLRRQPIQVHQDLVNQARRASSMRAGIGSRKIFSRSNCCVANSTGLGEVRGGASADYVVIELAASPEATLTVEDKKTGHHDEFPLRQVYERHEPATRIEFLDRQRTWLHGTVTESESGRPTPVRIAFQSSDGRYIPPYGHRTEINAGWFQDNGPTLRWRTVPSPMLTGVSRSNFRWRGLR